MLTYLDGHVPTTGGQPPVTEPENLVAAAKLLRQFHDLTAGMPLARDQEMVCHKYRPQPHPDGQVRSHNHVHRRREGSAEPVRGVRPRMYIMDQAGHHCFTIVLGFARDNADEAEDQPTPAS